MPHFHNEAIEMEARAMLREFIDSEEHQIGETSHTGESHIDRPVREGWIHDRHGDSWNCLTIRLVSCDCIAQFDQDLLEVDCVPIWGLIRIYSDPTDRDSGRSQIVQAIEGGFDD
jgi:hypothetical protein